MNIDGIGGLKRPREESVNEEQPSSLKELPLDILKKICFFLPTAKDIFVFERVFEKAREYTALAWDRCAKRDLSPQGLNIDWPLPDQERNRERACYIHGAVLSHYITSRNNIRSQTNRMSDDVKKLFNRFKEIMLCYPSSLGAYLWKDLNQLEKINSIDRGLFRTNPVLQSNLSSTAGGLLLQGLSYLNDHAPGPDNRQKQEIRGSAFKILSQAVQKGAACASHLAFQVLFPNNQFNSFYFHLAVSSINTKDHLGLRLIINQLSVDYIKQLYSDGVRYPPILVRIADLPHTSAGNKESLLDEATRDYQGHASADLLEKGCLIKLGLEKLEEAETYAHQALTAYDREFTFPSSNLLHHISFIKVNLKKWEEAEIYVHQALTAYHREFTFPSPPYLLNSVTFIKARLKKWEEAETYANQLLTACGRESLRPLPLTWKIRGNAKWGQNNKQEALEDWDKFIIESETQNQPIKPEFYMETSIRNRCERRLKKAENYCDRTLKAYKENNIPIPFKAWDNAFQIQCALVYKYKIIKNKVEFDEWFNTVIKAIEYGYKLTICDEENISVDVWLDMARLYIISLSMCGSSLRDQANTCLDKARACLESKKAYLNPEINANLDIAIDYQKVQVNILYIEKLNRMDLNTNHIKELYQTEKDFEVALNLYEKNKKGISASIYEMRSFLKLTIAEVTKELNPLKEAEATLHKAIELYKDQVPSESYLKMALIKKSLNKWQEAEEHADKARLSYEKGMCFDLLPKLYPTIYEIKQKLNKFTEAKENEEEAIRVYGEKYWYPITPDEVDEIKAMLEEKLSHIKSQST